MCSYFSAGSVDRSVCTQLQHYANTMHTFTYYSRTSCYISSLTVLQCVLLFFSAGSVDRSVCTQLQHYANSSAATSALSCGPGYTSLPSVLRWCLNRTGELKTAAKCERKYYCSSQSFLSHKELKIHSWRKICGD